jgi:hypothetical protein
MSEPITKSAAFKLLKLDRMNPAEIVVVPVEAINWLGLPFFRARVSALNSQMRMNLKTHQRPEGGIDVWYDPSVKKLNVNPSVLNLIDLRQKHEELTASYKTKQDSTVLDQMCIIDEQINALIQTLKHDPATPRKKRGNSLYQPLAVILKHLRLKESEWESLPGSDKTKLRIKAEIEIRDKQRINQS